MRRLIDRFRLAPAALFACGLVPLCCALAFGSRSKPQPLAIPASRPALAFHQYLVDLGPVHPSTEVRGTFIFQNRGDKPVRIKAVKPSCGCLTPRLEKQEYAPGESGFLALRIQPANEMPGQKEYFCDVEYLDPQPREVRVTFKVKLPQKQLLVRPKGLIFYQLGRESTTQPIFVSDTRGKAVRIQRFSSNSPLLSLGQSPDQVNPDLNVTEKVIDVTAAADCPTGRHQALVTIEVDDPDTPLLRVPVIIFGPAETPATPAQVPHDEPSPGDADARTERAAPAEAGAGAESDD